MLTTARLEQLEETCRRFVNGSPNDEIEEEMVIDLLDMLKDMALRNEVLRAEIEALRLKRNSGTLK